MSSTCPSSCKCYKWLHPPDHIRLAILTLKAVRVISTPHPIACTNYQHKMCTGRIKARVTRGVLRSVMLSESSCFFTFDPRCCFLAVVLFPGGLNAFVRHVRLMLRILVISWVFTWPMIYLDSPKTDAVQRGWPFPLPLSILPCQQTRPLRRFPSRLLGQRRRGSARWPHVRGQHTPGTSPSTNVCRVQVQTGPCGKNQQIVGSSPCCDRLHPAASYQGKFSVPHAGRWRETPKRLVHAVHLATPADALPTAARWISAPATLR